MGQEELSPYFLLQGGHSPARPILEGNQCPAQLHRSPPRELGTSGAARIRQPHCERWPSLEAVNAVLQPDGRTDREQPLEESPGQQPAITCLNCSIHRSLLYSTGRFLARVKESVRVRTSESSSVLFSPTLTLYKS